MSYGPVDVLVTAPRYTDLATVKNRLRIPSGNTDFDDRVTAAIVSAEIGIDLELGCSFPALGETLLEGFWVIEAGTGEPGDRRIRHDGDTELTVSTLASGPSDRLSLSDTELAEVVGAYVFQPGSRSVTLDVSAAVDSGDYWTFTTTVRAGDWSDLSTPLFSVGLILLDAWDEAGIPATIVQASTSIATAVYKAGDAPTGSAGSDDFIGTLDVGELVRAEIGRNPMLLGFKQSFGVG